MTDRDASRAAAAITTCASCGTRNRVPPVATGGPRCARCKAMLPWVADADDATFDEVVLRSPLPVVVDLWAPWCGPCRTVGPVLERLAAELGGQCKLVKVNVDHAPRTQARFGVQGIPTMVVLRDGMEVSRQVGAAPEEALRSWINSAVGATSG